MRITPGVGTTVNRAGPVVLNGVTAGAKMDLGKGDNVLDLCGGTVGALNVKYGQGSGGAVQGGCGGQTVASNANGSIIVLAHATADGVAWRSAT